MRHCNAVFKPEDIWFLLDEDFKIKRKLYLSICPYCNKKIALYSYFDNLKKEFYEKYYYSNGADKIKERLKKEVVSTYLNFKADKKSPYGFKFGENVEIIKNGKVVEIQQFSCDFYGNKILVKKIKNE